MEKPCAAKVDIELGGVEKVIDRNKSNKSFFSYSSFVKIILSVCAKNHHVNLQLYNLKSKDGSTWAGAWGKLTRLIPYMWPAKSASLQLRYPLRVDLLKLLKDLFKFSYLQFDSYS